MVAIESASSRSTTVAGRALGAWLLVASNPVAAAIDPGFGSASQVAAGGLHVCALAGGTVRCLGNNYFGQLGDGSSFDRPQPVVVQGLPAGIVAIATGGVHSCALDGSGAVHCWGDNSFGQLGDGSETPRTTAVTVSSLGGTAVAIAAGGFHSCALLDTGAIRCWGANEFGQLGRGDFVDSALPVTVLDPGESIAGLTAGGLHTCALADSGVVYCWGEGSFGQLGDGLASGSASPVAVFGLPGPASSGALGGVHSCALQAGAARCWGGNFLGQLGDGGADDQPTPVATAALPTTVAELALGAFHSCARLVDGSVHCWGFNLLGQLGDGSREDRSTAVTVAGIAGASAISAGGTHGCALVAGGAVRCWGNVGGREFAVLSAMRSAPSRAAASSASGRFVLFESDADDLLDGADGNGARDIFRLDRETGDRERVSIDDAEAEIGADSIEPAVSADGQLALFVTADAAVVKLRGESPKRAAARRKGVGHGVYLRNLLTGTTQRLGDARTGGAGTQPQIAAGGVAVVFTTTLADDQLGSAGQDNVLWIPLLADGNDKLPGAPVCVSCKASDGSGQPTDDDADGASRHPALSADGRYVAVETAARNLGAGAPACSQAAARVVMRDMLTGTTRRVGEPPSSANCGPAGSRSHKPRLDYSGDKLVFESDQPLLPGDDNALPDVFTVEVSAARLQRISDRDGIAADAAATDPAISGDGRVVSFVSAAGNLDPDAGAGNGLRHPHLRVLGEPASRRLDLTVLGEPADADSARVALDYNGLQLVFDSPAGNLAPGGTAAADNVYARANARLAHRIFLQGFE